MGREKTLFKNSLIYLIGNFGSKFLGILIIPLYTHYLNTEQFGYFDLVVSYITLLTPLVTFQITDALYRYLLDSKDSRESSKIITNSYTIMLLNLLILNLFLVILFQFVDFNYKYLFLIQLDTLILYTIWIQTARGLKQIFLYSVSGVIFTVVSLVSNLFFIIVLEYKVNGLILSNIIAAAVTFIYVEYKLRLINYFNFKYISRKFNLKLIKFSLPLIPNVVSWWVMNGSVRTLLTHYEGMQANGLFAIANKFPSILLMLNTIFSLAWQESVITESKSKDNKEFYTKMFNYYIIFQFTGVIIFLSITKFLMQFLVDESYYISWTYIPFLYLATIFSGFSSFYGASYLSSEKTMGSFYTSVLGAVVNLIVSICLIPVIGIQGACVATMFAFLTMWIARIINTRKYFKININIKTLVELSIITAVYVYLYYYENTILEFILFILALIIFALYNKKLLLKVKQVLFNKVKLLNKIKA
ncbi:lipopolysaccharide biosynthesis protein [Priestia megaterium]|uniref:lipopolysaccharide biosynthesis protein n=1 Tax=Priestia megaterium TaxID=1404 RepID=UPI0027308ECE|nr:oligosaccharide flippase family protein [Priestia megaterium]MDP1443104.1 oligosaccharide flippase family protein [Priestia megaterium]MDP1472230.1 oligosaccharide flippase family protein [Priestia megaterium]